MDQTEYQFVDLLESDKGIMKGPFGGDIKKDFFVPKSVDTFKVYEQSVVYSKNHKVGNYYISAERFSKLKRFEVKPKDILISGAGTLGDLYELPENIEPGIINQALIRLRINENVVDREFFKYYFSWYIKQVACRQIGASVIPNFPPIEDLKKITVSLPSLYVQRKIASVLSALDSKISLNRKMNRTLEAMAKQLYDYWFVQFDFPFDFAQGKPDAEGKPYKSSGGKMVWNEVLKREIPKGWEVKPLFESVSVQYGFPFSTESFTEEVTNIPVVRIRDILEGTISAYSYEETDEKYHLNEGDVLVGMDGNFHMNYWHNNNAYLNQRCVRIRPYSNSPISSIQVLHSIKPFIKAKEQNAKGSTVGHLSDKDMKSLFLFEPKVSQVFDPRKVFDPILKQIIKNKQEIASLTRQRDELLPLLMNGQVEVGE